MKPIGPGTQKIEMNSGEADYRRKLRAAKQNSHNPYIDGVRDVYADGPSHAVSDSRSSLGAPTVMPQTIADGGHANFEQKDTPQNAPTNIYTKQTGSLELGTSATSDPNKDPELFQTDALEKRLKLYASAGGSNEEVGLNNRETTYQA